MRPGLSVRNPNQLTIPVQGLNFYQERGLCHHWFNIFTRFESICQCSAQSPDLRPPEPETVLERCLLTIQLLGLLLRMPVHTKLATSLFLLLFCMPWVPYCQLNPAVFFEALQAASALC